MKQKILDDYFRYRKYQTPDLENSLLFFLTEVGELCHAIRTQSGAEFSVSTRDILLDMENVADEAEYVVSGRDEWIRNGDRDKAPNPGDEIGDCLMMLSRVGSSGGFGNPDVLLLNKMKKKGFVPSDYGETP